MRLLFLCFFIATFVNAQNLDEIIDYALEKHTSLQSIKEHLLAIEDEKALSRNFANPDISITVNDIQFDDMTNRELEPMQFSSVNFKQKIPYFGKRDAQTAKVESKKRLLEMSLQELKTRLKKEIKLSAYSLWEVQKRAEVLEFYIETTKQNIALNEAYNITSSNTHLALMSAKLALSQQKIKQSSLLSLKEMLYERLSYLAGKKIKQLDLSLDVKEPRPLSFYEAKVEDSTALHVKDAQVEVERAKLHIKELAGDIDPYVQAGYYYRQNHPDYATISIGASIPLYASEKKQEQIQRKLLLAKSFEKSDLEKRVQSKVAQTYAKLQSDYAVYQIITKESMPQIEHLFELQESSIKSGDTLFKYIDILNKKLSLDDELIKVTADYNKEEAILDALTGE